MLPTLQTIQKRRPSCWALYCCLLGMSRGAAWLNVPAPSGLADVQAALAARSIARFGNTFALFRLLSTQDLLADIGIQFRQAPYT